MPTNETAQESVQKTFTTQNTCGDSTLATWQDCISEQVKRKPEDKYKDFPRKTERMESMLNQKYRANGIKFGHLENSA